MTPEELNKQIIITNNKEHSEADMRKPKRLAKADTCKNIARITEHEQF